jgi:hypothetical protein
MPHVCISSFLSSFPLVPPSTPAKISIFCLLLHKSPSFNNIPITLPAALIYLNFSCVGDLSKFTASWIFFSSSDRFERFLFAFSFFFFVATNRLEFRRDGSECQFIRKRAHFLSSPDPVKGGNKKRKTSEQT